jgi:hypothetical protein
MAKTTVTITRPMKSAKTAVRTKTSKCVAKKDVPVISQKLQSYTIHCIRSIQQSADLCVMACNEQEAQNLAMEYFNRDGEPLRPGDGPVLKWVNYDVDDFDVTDVEVD